MVWWAGGAYIAVESPKLLATISVSFTSPKMATDMFEDIGVPIRNSQKRGKPYFRKQNGVDGGKKVKCIISKC